MKKKLFKAPSGATIPFTELGFGAAPIANLFRVVSDGDAQATLEAAWKKGIRYFDTAPLYGLGLSETRLNQFLRGKKRSDYVISTKVGRLLQVCAPEERTGIGKFFNTPNRREKFDYSYDGVMRSLEFSLERLGLDYVDLLLVHDLDVFTHGSELVRDLHLRTLFEGGGYRALCKLRDEKVIKAFGAGVNEWQVCQMMVERGDFDMFLLAGRYTLLEQEALKVFLPECEKRGVGIILGGPYNSGILATGAKPGAVYNYSLAPKDILARVAKIEAICRRHRVKLVEAALRFPLLHPSVVTAIPGAVGAKQVDTNHHTLSKKIPKALWTDLKQADLLHQSAPIG
jgi:D-threo-aldose 1-dehydrogenase